MSDGKGCQCAACCERQCACDVDWTPQELIDARKRIAELEAVAEAASEIAAWRTRNAILDRKDRALIQALRAAGYGGV